MYRKGKEILGLDICAYTIVYYICEYNNCMLAIMKITMD